MELSMAFQILKSRFKTHTAAADALGLTKDHYRALRNGRVAMPKRTADFIILKAEQAAKEAAQ